MRNPLICITLVMVCLTGALARFGYVGHAQTFAADLATVKRDQPRETTGRIYVSHDRARIETRQLADGFFIIDVTQPAAWFLRPRRQQFMDAKRSSPLTQIFVHVDPNDSCRQWRRMEAVAGAAGNDAWQCERVGSGNPSDAGIVKYQIVSRGVVSVRGVDPAREFPVRVEQADGTVVTLESIVDGPQPPALFSWPANYRKFDPLRLIEQIKQSDVWVEPHK